MKFMFLYLVGILNLLLGFFWMRRLRSKPTAPTEPDAKLDNATEGAAPPTADKAFQRLRAELEVQRAFFGSQATTLREGAGGSNDELQEIASETDVAAQRLLQTLTMAMDVFAHDADRAWQSQVAQLELLWSGISEATLQLVTFAFDDAEDATVPDEAIETRLIESCERVQQLCAEATQTIAAPKPTTAESE